MADKYILRVTAGTSYDLDEHTVIPVNQPTPTKLDSPLMSAELSVRIQNYRGLPRSSPTSSPYFDTAPHDYNKDQYSISFRFTPKQPKGSEEKGISALDLQFGNDFDHPIRDRLPPGFGTAMNIVKWWIDPGLEGDAYADEPFLYGPALSSMNTVHVGAGEHDDTKGGLWFEEGAGDDDAWKERRETGAPDDAKKRMKWALRKENKERWTWEYGRTYALDFYNPYVDFNEFALKLPGFTLPVIKYWDGQPLRYVLRNRATAEVYLVVLFTLYLKEDVNEDGSLKPAAVRATRKGAHDGPENEVKMGEDEKPEEFDEQKAIEEARRTLGDVKLEGEGKKQEVNGDDGGVD